MTNAIETELAGSAESPVASSKPAQVSVGGIDGSCEQVGAAPVRKRAALPSRRGGKRVGSQVT
jgi:hypothetical protein